MIGHMLEHARAHWGWLALAYVIAMTLLGIVVGKQIKKAREAQEELDRRMQRHHLDQLGL